MKTVGILLLLGIAVCMPQNGEIYDQKGEKVVSKSSGEDSLGDDSEYSESFESSEVALSEISEFQKSALTEMNRSRNKAGLKPLKLNDNLTKMAQMVASDQCKPNKKKLNDFTNLAFVSNNANVSTLAKNGVNKWYNEYKSFNCQPILEGRKDTDCNYKAAGNYIRMMSERYEWVGFGLTYKCQRPKGTGFIVAMFGGPTVSIQRVVKKELAAQGLNGSENAQLLDISRQAPCPLSFKP